MYTVRSAHVIASVSVVLFLNPLMILANEGGFVENSSLTLNTRQWYSHEIGHDNTYFRAQISGGSREVRDRIAWLVGVKLDYVSGLTQGTVGFGFDLSTYSAASLERSKLATSGGSNRLLVDKKTGNVVDDWSKVGVAALKVKVADTLLKVGRQQPARTPVMGYSDTRTLPASFHGVSLESHDIEGLTIKSGYFDETTPRTGGGSQKLSPSFGSHLVASEWVAYAGADYRDKDGRHGSIYVSRFDNIWDREYLGLGNKYTWREFTINVDVDVYNTRSSGSQVAGKIDQQAYGITLAPRYKNHMLKLGIQQIRGDEYFDFIAESNAINLPNVLVSDYNGPNERSFQVNYGSDFVGFGLPGLNTNIWYAKGWNIDGTHYNGGANGIYSSVIQQSNEGHHEVGVMASYVIQSGEFKGVNLFSVYSWHRASAYQAEGNFDEFRLIVNAPIKIF